MGILDFLDIGINFVLSPVLKMGYLVSIFVVALFVALVMVLVYKWMTDQQEMKSLKDQLDKYRKEARENRADPKKVMEINKKMMSVNSQYMKHSLKPTFVTIIPMIALFAWLSLNLAYQPIAPGQEFSASILFTSEIQREVSLAVPEGIELIDASTQNTTSNTITWKMKAVSEGDYTVLFKYDGQELPKEVKVTNGLMYSYPEKRKKIFLDGLFDFFYTRQREGYLPADNKDVYMIKIGNQPVKPFGSISIFGWHPGWFGTYFIFSLALSLLLRKVMKVY